MRILFLDLEDTVITPVPSGWQDFEVIHLTVIKDIIEKFKPDAVDIFSFAIHNERELEGFNTHTRPYLEKMLGVKLSTVPTVDTDIKNAICKQKKLSPKNTSFSDMCDFWGKDLSFQLYIQERFKHNDKNYPLEFIFLDDAVKSSLFQTFDKHITAYTLNIDDLKIDFDEICAQVPFLNEPGLIEEQILVKEKELSPLNKIKM